MSPAPDSTLADPQQEVIADLRRELAQCRAERDEALARETATAEVLQVVNSSPGDLSPVFDAILNKAHELCGAELGVLMSFDGELFRPVATHGGSARFLDATREGFRPAPDNLFAHVLRGEPFFQFADLAELAAQGIDDPQLKMAVEIGIRTFLIVPLRKEEKLLGAITANRREVRPFTEKQIALLQNFAAQAVIAMENARLITETREALEQQTATAEVLGVINSSPGDLAPVFDAMLEKALRLCEASFGWLRTHDNDSFQLAAIKGVPAPYAEFLALNAFGMPPSQARVLAGERLIHIPDLSNTEEYRTGEPNRRAIVDLGGARTLLLAPLLKDETLRGYFSIYRQQARPFSDRQIALLENFAAQAVIAMENARLITETREALEQQTATAEVLGVINSSPGDLDPVFDAMLDKALALSGASFGGLSTYDGQQFRAVATRGIPPELTDFYSKPFTPGPESYHGRLAQGETVLHVEDLAAEQSSALPSPLTEPGVGAGRALVELGGARVVTSANFPRPLPSKHHQVGAIVATRSEAVISPYRRFRASWLWSLFVKLGWTAPDGISRARL